jgi:hypothetical protein
MIKSCGIRAVFRIIFFSNHYFDSEERSKGRHRRKKGLVTKPDEPAHGERGVRQYHARDDSKILAHHRLGLLDLPE